MCKEAREEARDEAFAKKHVRNAYTQQGDVKTRSVHVFEEVRTRKSRQLHCLEGTHVIHNKHIPSKRLISLLQFVVQLRIVHNPHPLHIVHAERQQATGTLPLSPLPLTPPSQRYRNPLFDALSAEDVLTPRQDAVLRLRLLAHPRPQRLPCTPDT